MAWQNSPAMVGNGGGSANGGEGGNGGQPLGTEYTLQGMEIPWKHLYLCYSLHSIAN